MPRDRYQHGWIEETGKKVKKWKGYYYVYILTVDGKEKRKHCSAILGLKSEMRKWEAERELATIIERKSRGKVQPKPDPSLNFEWFWINRFLPLKESKWRRSTKEAVTYVMGSHVLPRFGETRLCDLTRFELQSHLNKLAKKYSKSVVQKARTWLKAAIEEAIDQDFLFKNPARKLEMPVTRKSCKRYLSAEEVHKLLMALDGRDRLIARMLIVCALRPGELFALRWRNVQEGRLKIEEAVYHGELGPTKTEGSAAMVAIPESLQKELEFWREKCRYPDDVGFVFPSRKGTPLEAHNCLRRVLKSKGKEVGIEGLTFQAMRRTFGTQVHGIGTVKDAQMQLRHSNATTTMNIYTQEIPSSVKATVEALDQKLFGVLNTIEHEFRM